MSKVEISVIPCRVYMVIVSCFKDVIYFHKVLNIITGNLVLDNFVYKLFQSGNPF